MIYIFPIFLFGCVMTGVVFLGILEAAEQLKRADAIKQMQNPALDDKLQASFFPVHPEPSATDKKIS